MTFALRVRESEMHSSTTIIMVIGKEEATLEADARAAGVTSFLAKPVSVLAFKALSGELLLNGGWPLIERNHAGGRRLPSKERSGAASI